MKDVDFTRVRTRSWLDKYLTARVAAGDNSGLTISLGALKGQALRDQWPSARAHALAWRAVDDGLPQGIEVDWRLRQLQKDGKADQELPVGLMLPTLGAAATWAGGQYPARLHTALERWQLLTEAFPETATEDILSAIMKWDALDVNLLLTTAQWMSTNPVPHDTWTPRQVPVPGLHAKWLDVATRRSLVGRLTGAGRIHLRGRPTQARVTYLDPEHIESGGRHWDIVTAGDSLVVPYQPTTVIIVENRDTAFFFPPEIPGGIVVLGNGDAATSLVTTAQPLMMAATQVIYWGDIDAQGLRIVSRLRERGHQVRTMLMDLQTYEAYSIYGTDIDQNGKHIGPGDPTLPPCLTPDESALFARLTDPAWVGFRRIEQERIPLEVALAEVVGQV